MAKIIWQKLFGKKYNRLAIVLSSLLLLAIAIIILLPLLALKFGVHEKYTVDVAEAYQDYWQYSLGNYTFERIDEHRDEAYNYSADWYNYTFTFADVNGNSREISINNLHWKRKASTSNSLDKQLIYQAETFLEEDVINIFAKQDILNIDNIKAPSTSIYCYAKQINQNINPSNTKNGIRFNTLSLNTLAENNLYLHINIYVDLVGKLIAYPNIKQALISATGIIFKNYEYSNIEIRFVMRPSDLDGSSNYTSYYLTYDGVNYHWSDNTFFTTD